MNTHKIASTIAAIAFVLAISALFAWAINVGMSRQEVVDCNQWQQQASVYPGFFLAKWQDEQCMAHGIIIQVPVK